MFRRESQFPPSESPKITSSTCISPPAARRGRLSTSCFGGSTTRTRVTTKDPRSGDGIAKTLVYPIYPSFIRVALGNRAASNRSNNSDLVFCHFRKTVPSTLPSSPPSLLARPLSKRILRLPIPRDQPPQNNRLHVRDRSEQTCSRARAQGNQSARRSFQTVPSSHSELGKHACSPPTRFLRGLFFETFRLERDSAPTS